jgi:ABC-type antimicrobial peptide transport system permease subunit
MNLYVRTKGDAEQILTPVERVVHEVAPPVVVSEVRTASAVVAQSMGFAKIGVQLLGIFGLLALSLASVGLYGVMSYSVNRRRREIGVRMALGATQTTVLMLVLRKGLILVGAGLALGLAASLMIGGALSRLLYGVSTTDPISISTAGVVLLVVALVACYLPARGASRVDPIVALREG